jgi:WD40 repeat protein
MYDLNKHTVIRVLRGHENSLRQLAFIEGYGGFLISSGYEITARVWQPGNVTGDALLGKLKGHNHPITGMCVLPHLPTVLTIDE